MTIYQYIYVYIHILDSGSVCTGWPYPAFPRCQSLYIGTARGQIGHRHLAEIFKIFKDLPKVF